MLERLALFLCGVVAGLVVRMAVAAFRPPLRTPRPEGYDWWSDDGTRELLRRLQAAERDLERERTAAVDTANERDGWRLRAQQLGANEPMSDPDERLKYFESRKQTETPLNRRGRSEHERTALHEAGHALAAWACTHVVRVTSVKMYAEGGHVALTYETDSQWAPLVVTLAGMAAESAVYGRGKLRPCKNDLVHALEMAQKLIESAKPVPWTDPAERSLRFGSFYDGPLSADEERILASAYKMARHIVRRSGPRLRAVATLLQERGTLSERDLEELLPCRALIRSLGAARPVAFVLPQERTP